MGALLLFVKSIVFMVVIGKVNDQVVLFIAVLVQVLSPGDSRTPSLAGRRDTGTFP